MKKDKRNLRIQFEPEGLVSTYREVYYRIHPCELNIFQRLFCNRWYRMYHGFDHIQGKSHLWTCEQYKLIKDSLHTWGDVQDYLNREWEKIRMHHEREVNAGRSWPDYWG